MSDIIDAIEASGRPGHCRCYRKEEFMHRRLPVKLSPHQAGVQEMLLVSELRGRCPREVTLCGIIPSTLEPGSELSPVLKSRMPEIAQALVDELRRSGLGIAPQSAKAS